MHFYGTRVFKKQKVLELSIFLFLLYKKLNKPFLLFIHRYDIDWKGNTCSPLNQLVSNTLLPYLICALIMFQMHFAEILLFMAKRPVYLTKWHAFKFILAATICYLFAFDEIRTYECTTILDMPTLISERILEWCNTEFSAGALAMYGVAAVVGYDDPAEVSKFKTFTTSTILYIAVAVVAAQLVFFRSFHLSLFCFFCFGMIYPALFGSRKILRGSKACW